MKPLISIVIPVYNGADFLHDAIKSALAQTYGNYEILVVNDGSDDESEQIALSYGDSIRYFKKENGGVATALNLALREMKGEYFSWLSHDDFYYPQKLERQMDALEKCGDLTRILISDYDIYDNERKTLSHYHMENMYPRQAIENSVFSILQGLVGGCSMLIHKSHFARVGGFDERLRTTQDYDLWFRMFRGQKLLYLPECVMTVRAHPGQGIRTIPTHHQEQDQLHLGFAKKLTREEEASLFGSSYCCLYELLRFSRLNHLEQLEQYAEKRFEAERQPENTAALQKELYHTLMLWGHGRTDRICLFGAGKRGRRLYQELAARGIRGAMFADNAQEKIGGTVCGIPCVGINKASLSDTLVIVTPKDAAEMQDQLVQLGCTHWVNAKEIWPLFYKVPTSGYIVVEDE